MKFDSAVRISAVILMQLNIIKCTGIGMNFFSWSFPHPLLMPDTDASDFNSNEEWFEQRLDHSDPSNQQTWKQRYFQNTHFYEQAIEHNRTGMPLFILIGGECEALSYWVHRGYYLVLAKENEAMFFHLEHRFYGKSHPTLNLTLDNLEYLTSQQALSDLVEFTKSMKLKWNMTDDNKVVVFGASYAGNLAAWARLKYPDEIYAAVGSSAPVEAKVDFFEYFNVVSNILESYRKECASAVHEAFGELKNMVKSTNGCNNATKLFNLCTALNPDSQEDVDMLFSAQSEIIGRIVQYNKNQIKRKGKPTTLAEFNIDDMCEILTDEGESNALMRLVNLNIATMTTCLKIDFKDYSKNFAESISWDSEHGKNSTRQWTFQLCNELGYFQTSKSQSSLLHETISVESFERICKFGFTERFTNEKINQNIDNTNSVYLGKNITQTRILFVHGTIDPWHSMGITESKSDDVVAILIEGASHTADFLEPRPDDLPSLQEARKNISNHLNRWLSK